MKEGIGMDVDMVIEGGEKEKWLGKQKVGVVYSFTILINKFSGIKKWENISQNYNSQMQ